MGLGINPQKRGRTVKRVSHPVCFTYCEIYYNVSWAKKIVKIISKISQKYHEPFLCQFFFSLKAGRPFLCDVDTCIIDFAKEVWWHGIHIDMPSQHLRNNHRDIFFVKVWNFQDNFYYFFNLLKYRKLYTRQFFPERDVEENVELLI